MYLRALGRVLNEADGAIAVAVRLCAELPGVTVVYLADDGTPLVLVDSIDTRDDAQRTAYLGGEWRHDALLRRVVETYAVVEDVERQLTPILHPDGLLGAIKSAPSRQVLSVATLVSARLAQLGVQPWSAASEARLTPRQREIAALAVEGATTEEIAQQLAISRNTVKASLKQIFERLDIDRRVELVAALQRECGCLDAPATITRIERVTITPAPRERPVRRDYFSALTASTTSST